MKEDIDNKEELVALYDELKDKNEQSSDFPLHAREMLDSLINRINRKNYGLV